VSITARSSHLCVLSSEKLSHLYTSHMMHDSRSDALGGVLRSPRYASYCDGVASWGYKFTLHLIPISISHPSLLLAFRVLFFPVVY
jgi:hypothetical protein